MTWRIFRRFTVIPGVRLNVSRTGASLSIGQRGITTTVGRRGIRTTVGVPGTGVSYSKNRPWNAPGSVARLCPACGIGVPRTANFCGKCGATL